MFGDGGRFTQWNPDAFVPFLPASIRKKPTARANAAIQKFNFWSKKQNVGIIPKMASNSKYRKQLFGAKVNMDYTRERLAPNDEHDIWIVLLTLKFKQNASLRQVLLGTKFIIFLNIKV